MHWLVVMIGWALAIAACMALVYGLFIYRRGTAYMDKDLGYTYNAMKRLTWSVGIAWLTLACINGYGGTDTVSCKSEYTPVAMLVFKPQFTKYKEYGEIPVTESLL